MSFFGSGCNPLVFFILEIGTVDWLELLSPIWFMPGAFGQIPINDCTNGRSVTTVTLASFY